MISAIRHLLPIRSSHSPLILIRIRSIQTTAISAKMKNSNNFLANSHSQSHSPYSLFESRISHYISPTAIQELKNSIHSHSHSYSNNSPTYHSHPIHIHTNSFIITLGGDQLTGKSTLAKRLNKLLNHHPLSLLTANNISIHNNKSNKNNTNPNEISLPQTLYSAGTIFRSLANEMHIPVGELSKLAISKPEIDVKIEYSLLKLICNGIQIHQNKKNLVLNNLLLNNSLKFYSIIEGRQPSVMATYVKNQLGKSNILRIYLKCSIYEQAIRFIEREIKNSDDIEYIKLNLPKYKTNNNNSNHNNNTSNELIEYTSLNEISLILKQFPISNISHICELFESNENRDRDDRIRYEKLYGRDKLLDYRNNELYDIIIDTSNNTVDMTYLQALDGLRNFGISIPNTVATEEEKINHHPSTISSKL